MFVLQVMSAAMEFVPLVCLSLVTWSGITSADGPTVIQQVVKEDGDAVLSCSFGENIKGKLFDWRKDGDTEVFFHGKDGTLRPGRLFQGRVSHFPEALQSGNASIVIRGTKVSDSGIYTCDFPNDPPETRSTISLTVEQILKDRSSEKIPGAAAKPSLTSLNQTKDSSLLQCEIQGAFPKPHVKWQDSAGNILPAEEHTTERGGKYDVTLQTTVTKTDRFLCTSTQREISHQIHAGIHVYIHGAVKPEIKILDQTNEWSLLQCLIRGVSPKTKLQWKDSFQNVVPAKEPEVRERGGSYDIILQTTVTKSDYYHCVATQEETGLQTEADTYVSIGGFPYGIVIGLSVTVVVLIAAIVVALTVIIKRHRNQRNQRGGNTPDNEVPLKSNHKLEL